MTDASTLGIDLNDPDTFEDRKKPEVVYHYTGVAGFLGIIESKVRFWATHNRYLNDSGEGKFGLELFKAALADLECDDAIRTQVNDELQLSASFIASFSESPSVLSQWRAYARDGRGYCLGVKTPENWGLFYDEIEATESLVKCLYDKNRARERLLQRCRRKVEVFGSESVHLASELSGVARHYADCIKHEHFGEEREWRLVVSSSDPNHVKYRATDRELVPYLMTEALELKEVWVGPGIGPDPDTAKDVTSRFLKKHGVDAEVKYWKSSFVGG